MSREQGRGLGNSLSFWDGTKWTSLLTSQVFAGPGEAGYVPRLNLAGHVDLSFVLNTDTSTGIPDGGKLTKLNLLGKLDQSLISNVQASAGIPDAGKFVRLDAAGKLGLSLTNNTQSSTGVSDAGKFLRLAADGSIRVAGQSKFNVKGYPNTTTIFVAGPVTAYTWNPKTDGGWLHVFYNGAGPEDFQLSLDVAYMADNDFRGDELVVTIQQAVLGTGTISVWPAQFRFSSVGDMTPTVGNGAMTKYEIFNTVNVNNMLVTKTAYP